MHIVIVKQSHTNDFVLLTGVELNDLAGVVIPAWGHKVFVVDVLESDHFGFQFGLVDDHVPKLFLLHRITCNS